MSAPSHTVVAVSTKSAILAFILTVLFGPFGFLYVSVGWALASMVIYGVLFVLTLGLAGVVFPVLNVLMAIVGVLMVQSQNQAQIRRIESPIVAQ